jgi:hypothetical protein
LREATRRADVVGTAVVAFDCRGWDLSALGEAFAGIPTDHESLLVMVDEADRLGVGLHGLGTLIAGLPDCARVVVAGRRFAPGWLPADLEAVTQRETLGSLTDPAADEVLVRAGVSDGEARSRIAVWARGLPLALTLGARGWVNEPHRLDVVLDQAADDVEANLTEGALAQFDPDALTLAAMARGLNADLLSAVLPGLDVEATLTGLSGCSFVERRDGLLVLHELLAESLVARAQVDGRFRRLALPAALHLAGAALRGDTLALLRLPGLTRNEVLQAMSVRSPAFAADRLRPGDVEALRASIQGRYPGAWPLIVPWLGEERGAWVLRDGAGAPVAAGVVLPLDAAERIEGAHRVQIEPVIEFAHRLGIHNRACIVAFMYRFDEDDAALRSALGAQVGYMAGSTNLRAVFANQLWPIDGGFTDVRSTLGFQEATELAREVDGNPVWTTYYDLGEGGLVGVYLAAVAAESGVPMTMFAGPGLVAALEGFHDDAALAAQGANDPGLARMWVGFIVAARLAAHGELLDVIRARYLAPDTTNDEAARALLMSRATFYRRLGEARDLLTSP